MKRFLFLIIIFGCTFFLQTSAEAKPKWLKTLKKLVIETPAQRNEWLTTIETAVWKSDNNCYSRTNPIFLTVKTDINSCQNANHVMAAYDIHHRFIQSLINNQWYGDKNFHRRYSENGGLIILKHKYKHGHLKLSAYVQACTNTDSCFELEKGERLELFWQRIIDEIERKLTLEYRRR